MDKKMTKFCLAISLFIILVVAGQANSGALVAGPEAYMPESIDGVAVKTCMVDVSGKSTCGPQTLGEAALDSARLGFTMMTVSGLTGSEDKRWDHVVYGVSDKLCTEGGTSVGVMHIQPGIYKENQKELEGLITSKKLPLEQTKIEGVDFYIGYLQSRDCIMAFGYPNDSTVMLVFAGKDDKEKVRKVVKSMLGAAKTK